jgi:hypothetical protein
VIWECFLRRVLLAVTLYSCSVCLAQPSALQGISPKAASVADPNVTEFLPENAKVIKELKVDFENDGVVAVVLAYGSDTVPDVTAGVVVLKYGANGWAVNFEETDSMTNGAGASDAINIEKIRSSGGKEGVVVVLKASGAGTSTDWHMLASVKNKILKLESTGTRDKVLKARGYVFMGYNGVTVDGNAVIESLSGYSSGTAACCPDRPSIAITSRFTGTSIKLESVKKFPL